MGEEQRGVILYGYEVEAVAEALQELDPRYVSVDGATSRAGQVPVVRCSDGAEADAAQEAAPAIAWLVVQLYRPGDDVRPARAVRLWLNISTVDPRSAARAIDQPDLVVWYEVIAPVRVGTVDGGPVMDDYSDLTMTVPEGHRMVAHAVRAGGTPPECLPSNAEMVLPSDDLWALSRSVSRSTAVCQACVTRHG